MIPKVFKSIALGMAVVVVASSRLAYSDGMPIFSYDVRITQIDGGSLFSIFTLNRTIQPPMALNRYRIWGVDVAAQTIPVDLLDGVFTCVEKGDVQTETIGRVRIVSCESYRGDLGQLLIKSGNAVEICSETQNKYETCPIN